MKPVLSTNVRQLHAELLIEVILAIVIKNQELMKPWYMASHFAEVSIYFFEW